jgi:3-hydroxyisobutyrate dehydrogenase-like beta-hydroxyacid dehydrogenase
MLNNGCEGAANSAELFAKSDYIMISMPTSKQVEMNMYGEEGILANARPGTVVIDLTSGDATVTQKLCKQCEEKGIEMIDAPISGGQKGATEQTLAVMVGGKKETFEKARHILETIGDPKKVTYVGASGAGDAMKCINNYVSCTNFLATAEALSVAVKAGIDPRVACSVIQNSGGQSNATAYKFPSLIFKGNPMSMAVDLMMKDIALYNSLAKDIKVPSMYGNLSFQMFNILSSSGRGMEDFSNVARLYEEWSGAKLWEVDKD